MREPSLEQLRMLLAVQAEGSLTAAAERLNVTQQAVSQRMRALERGLGLSLFERAARGTTLTSHGQLVADWAAAVTDRMDALTTASEALRADAHAQLTVAASVTIAEHLFPSWLITASAQGTPIHVELQAVNSSAVIEAVKSGSVDIGFIESPHPPARLRSREVARDDVIVVVAPTHPWARRSSISADTLAATPLVMREAGSGTRTTVEEALLAAGMSLVRPAAELSTSAAIRAMALSGGAVAAMSELAVRDDITSGRLVKVSVDGVEFTRPLTAVWDGTTTLTPAARRFLDVARTLGAGG